MRSFKLLAVAVLAVLLVASSLTFAFGDAAGQLQIGLATIDGCQYRLSMYYLISSGYSLVSFAIVVEWDPIYMKLVQRWLLPDSAFEFVGGWTYTETEGIATYSLSAAGSPIAWYAGGAEMVMLGFRCLREGTSHVTLTPNTGGIGLYDDDQYGVLLTVFPEGAEVTLNLNPPAGAPVGAIEFCVIQLGVEEQNGTVVWLPGYAYVDVPISQCENKSEYYADVLGRTIVIHQFNQTRISY